MLEDFENLMFPFWDQITQKPEEISSTRVNEMEDPTQGDEIRTPWGGCVD